MRFLSGLLTAGLFELLGWAIVGFRRAHEAAATVHQEYARLGCCDPSGPLADALWCHSVAAV